MDRRVERLPADEVLDSERAPELVASLTSAADWLTLDLVGKDLPEHLPSA